MAHDLHVDQRDVLVADDPLRLQLAEDRGGPLAFADLDGLRGLGEAFVRRGDGAPEEVAAGDEQEDREDQDRAERLQVLAAAAAVSGSRGYGILLARSSR
jgi:hypothetical protein